MSQLVKQVNGSLRIEMDSNYKTLLEEIKFRLRSSKLKASIRVNNEMIQFYWEVGKLIVERQSISKWGDKVFDALAHDLSISFPDTKGFSKTNLKYMRMFYLHYSDAIIGQTLSDQLTWSQHLLLIQRFNIAEREIKQWYINQTIDNGWSFRYLKEQIMSNLYGRQSGNNIIKTTNFHEKLPVTTSELAHEMIKDPYKFHFLTVGDDALEKEIHDGLITHIRKFLMELGQGFAFYGSKYPIQISERRFEIDLIFYHTKLHSYVVVELKRGELHPQHTGQLNFYLAAIDEQLKMPEDGPTIGLLLCEKKDKIIAEYSLKRVTGPIGIAEYEVLKKLPSKLQKILPTIDQIEAELTEFSNQNNDN